MYQTIHEPIAVVGVYDHHTFTPKKFKWQHRYLKIDQITLTSNIKDGGVRKRFYSVVCGANVYRIEFNREDETWLLEEVWCD
jgi:hypothetical protein